jgi:hypothetical protein
MESPPADFSWSVTGRDIGTFRDYEWLVIDKGMGIHADGMFWVAHVQIDDHVGSLLVAQPEIEDHLGSLVVRGYALDDHLGSMLVQGWRHDDHLGSLLAAVPFFNDHLGSLLVGKLQIDDHLGSVVVFGVNRNNKIEVHVIDETTYQALLADNVGFS